MREIVKADHPFVREEATKEQARALFPGEPYKEELLADIPDESRFPLPDGELPRPVPGAACAGDRPGGRVPSDEHRRGILARRFEEQDAHAGLRGRLRVEKELDEHLRILEEIKKRTTASWAGKPTCSA